MALGNRKNVMSLLYLEADDTHAIKMHARNRRDELILITAILSFLFFVHVRRVWRGAKCKIEPNILTSSWKEYQYTDNVTFHHRRNSKTNVNIYNTIFYIFSTILKTREFYRKRYD